MSRTYNNSVFLPTPPLFYVLQACKRASGCRGRVATGVMRGGSKLPSFVVGASFVCSRVLCPSTGRSALLSTFGGYVVLRPFQSNAGRVVSPEDSLAHLINTALHLYRHVYLLQTVGVWGTYAKSHFPPSLTYSDTPVLRNRLSCQKGQAALTAHYAELLGAFANYGAAVEKRVRVASYKLKQSKRFKKSKGA